MKTKILLAACLLSTLSVANAEQSDLLSFANSKNAHYEIRQSIYSALAGYVSYTSVEKTKGLGLSWGSYVRKLMTVDTESEPFQAVGIRKLFLDTSIVAAFYSNTHFLNMLIQACKEKEMTDCDSKWSNPDRNTKFEDFQRQMISLLGDASKGPLGCWSANSLRDFVIQDVNYADNNKVTVIVDTTMGIYNNDCSEKTGEFQLLLEPVLEYSQKIDSSQFLRDETPSDLIFKSIVGMRNNPHNFFPSKE